MSAANSFIPERDLGSVAAAPTDMVRIVRNGKSLSTPAALLPVPEAAERRIEAVEVESSATQARVESLENSQTSGLIGYPTKVLLDADLAHAAGALAMVTNDPIPENNGTYRKEGASGAGAWVPAEDRISAAERRISDSAAAILAVADEAGYTGLIVTDDTLATAGLEVSPARIQFGAQSFERSDDFSFAITDDFGFIGYAVLPDGTVLSGLSGGGDDEPGEFSDADINAANQHALAYGASVRSAGNSIVARPVWDYNHFLVYGQSLSTGMEGWPALSVSARLGNLMFGDSVRPASKSAAAFTPLGGAVLKPLVSVVQDATDQTIILDASAQAALAPGDIAEGEEPGVGMVNFAKLQHNQRMNLENDPRAFVVSNCGVNGRTIEALSLGASPLLWNRLTQAAQGVKSIATAAGKSYGIAAVAFLQGEWNYDSARGGDTTKAGYKAKLDQLYADIQTTVVSAISGQSKPPLFLTYQTTASFTVDATNLSIGMAQLELANERQNWVMVGPSYPYTDKGGHLDSNGYRWMGKQFAKVWNRVVGLGEGWKPLQPISAVIRGREVLVTFHVPCPPLVFSSPYVVTTATDFANKGFTVLSDGVSVALSSVQIVSDCVVRLVLAADPAGSVELRYAGKAVNNGNGCVRDSDMTQCDENYEFIPGSGQYAGANIAALVGKPYPLQNWCVAFQIPVTNV